MQISLHKTEERAIRDTIFLGINSKKARDKTINLMNEEEKELTVEFLMQQLEIEDYNAHHKSPSQLDSSMSVNFAVTTLQMDASKKGLGACLIQKGKVTCYASRALTKTKQNYQNLEREMHLEPSGEWKSSTTFCMEKNLHWKLTRSHL